MSYPLSETAAGRWRLEFQGEADVLTGTERIVFDDGVLTL